MSKSLFPGVPVLNGRSQARCYGKSFKYADYESPGAAKQAAAEFGHGVQQAMFAQAGRTLTKREIATGRIAIAPEPSQPHRPESIQAVLDSRGGTRNPWRARLEEVEARRARTDAERGRKATRIAEYDHKAEMWDAAKAAETAEAERVAALEQSGARENARKCAERLHTEARLNPASTPEQIESLRLKAAELKKSSDFLPGEYFNSLKKPDGGVTDASLLDVSGVNDAQE